METLELALLKMLAKGLVITMAQRAKEFVVCNLNLSYVTEVQFTISANTVMLAGCRLPVRVAGCRFE